jgi:hypothetical protein
VRSEDASIDKIEFLTVHTKYRLELKFTLRIGRIERANDSSLSTIRQSSVDDRAPPIGDSGASENSFESIVSHCEDDSAVGQLFQFPFEHSDPLFQLITVNDMLLSSDPRKRDLSLDDIRDVSVRSTDPKTPKRVPEQVARSSNKRKSLWMSDFSFPRAFTDNCNGGSGGSVREDLGIEK